MSLHLIILQKKNDHLINNNIPYNNGKVIGKVIDFNLKYISILLFDELRSGDGISIGNINEQKGNEDIRVGFTVNRIFIKKLISNEAKTMDIIRIPLPKDIHEKIKLRKNDLVYKTYDCKFIKNILQNMPINSNNEVIKIINNCKNNIDFINKIGSVNKKIKVSIDVNIKNGTNIEFISLNNNTKEVVVLFSEYIIQSSEKYPISKDQVYDYTL